MKHSIHRPRSRWLAAGGILLVAALTAIFVIPSIASAREHDAQVSSPLKTAFVFTAGSPAPGGISETQAVATARRCAQALPEIASLPSGITESVYYGQFSDSSFSPRPVWLVVYTGPAVNVPVIEGIPALHAGSGGSPTGPIAHEETVAVDATTGQFLEEDMASNLPALPAHAVAVNQGS